ncbi:MAG TPA: hypothetical protein DDW29_13795 [Gammaproteobacteria bacterium]|nr:hypothetical protein [Gammaproteobacteria bacterium]
MPPRLLTAQEKNKLRKVCSEVDNWTAMGLWKGSGKEPNCYKFEKHNSTTTIVTDFKTQQDVDKWNSNGEATNRYKGYAVGAIVNLIAARFNLSVGTNTVLGIAQGEAGAKLFTYPKASIGSKYIVVTKFNYQWSPSPFHRSSLKVSSRTVMVDPNGRGTYERNSEDEFYLEEFSDTLARTLSMAPPKLIRISP